MVFWNQVRFISNEFDWPVTKSPRGVERVHWNNHRFFPIVKANVTDVQNAITDSISSHYQPLRVEITKENRHMYSTHTIFVSKRKYKTKKKERRNCIKDISLSLTLTLSPRGYDVCMLHRVSKKENKLTIKEQQRAIANFVPLRTERRIDKRRMKKIDRDTITLG